ncbi:MAG TPA: sulfide-quinone oxidoreductase [Campylobacterales bacterium]|nr:sulfide-quinone oxidoreductase [Campylobacterales bacterium]
MVMKKIVILGSGFAGLHIFYKIRHLIGEKIEVTVIDSRSHALLKPSLPEIAFEGAPLSHSLVELEHTLERYGASFIENEVEKIVPETNVVALKDGQRIEYDYLFVTLGAVKNYDAIKGYDAYGYSVCDDVQAQKLWEKVKTFEGGSIVTGAAKSHWGSRVDAPKLAAPCEGPIGEVMFMFDYYLTKERGLERSKDYKIDIFTPSEIFFEDVGEKPHEVIDQFMHEKEMTLHNNKIITEIGKDFVAFEDGSTLPCDLAIIIPPYAAPKVILDSKLGDEKGFVPTDTEMRHLDYENIFAAGDITALAQPKLGHIAIIQAGIAAASLLKQLGEEVKIPPHDLEVFCIINMGGHEATLIDSNSLYGGTRDIAFYSPISKMMKWGFDNYLYFNKGHMPPDWALNMTDKLVKLL